MLRLLLVPIAMRLTIGSKIRTSGDRIRIWPSSQGQYRYVGLVRSHQNDRIVVEVKHKIEKGMVLEGISPKCFQPISIPVRGLYDPRNGQSVDTISSGRIGQAIEIQVNSEILELLPPLSVIRICL